MGSAYAEVAVLIVLVVLNGVFSLAEMAVVTARSSRLQQRAEAGQGRARVALELADNPGRFLSTIQIVITLVGVLAGAFGGVTLGNRLGQAWQDAGLLGSYAYPVAVGLVVVVTTYFSLILGELVPKRLALGDPERLACLVAPTMHRLSRLAAPLVWLLSHSTEGVLRLLRVRPAPHAPVTDEEIALLLRQGIETGHYQPAEAEMVAGVLRLDTRRAAALMTPRPDLVWLDLQAEPEEQLRTITEAGFSRLPVAESSLDRVRGVLYVKELIPRLAGGEPLRLPELWHEPVLIPETMPALAVLETFQQQGTHVALVVDEYGSVQGLITLHDLLAAILGQVAGAETAEEPAVVRRADGSLLLDGMLPVDELKSLLRLRELPDEDRGGYLTLGGFLMARLGRIPRIGEQCTWEGWSFEVVDMDGHRVDRVLVSSPPPDSAPDPDRRATGKAPDSGGKQP